MNHPDEAQATDSSDLLTQQANSVRARMLRRIDLLQARRRALGRAIGEIRVEGRHLLPALAGVAIATVAVAVLLRGRATRQRRRAGFRLPAFGAAPPHQPGFVKRSLQGVAVSLTTRMLQRAAEHAVQRWLSTRASSTPTLAGRVRSEPSQPLSAPGR
jgi:hypothetical protein